MAPIGNKNGLKHGRSRTPEYQCWINMWVRCTNPNNPQYKDYGGRGIYVCKRWSDFVNFFTDMGPRPKGHSIERIDNDGPYSPKNCHWTTRRDQQRNRRSYRVSLAREAERLGIKYGTLWMRLKRQQMKGISHG